MQLSTESAATNPQVVHSYPHLIVHYGELALKGKNRHRFEARLLQTLRDKLHQIGPCAVRKLPGRIWVEFVDGVSWDRLTLAVKNTFGVANARGMYRCEPTPVAIEALALDCAGRSAFGTFAIRCRRAEKNLPMTSRELCVQLGRSIEVATGARVDLEHPEWTLWIEILNAHCFLGHQRVDGPGGLPVGMSGKVAVLLSGGIDSPVAAWRMMRRGCAVTFIHFHSTPFTSAASLEKVTELARLLGAWQGPSQLAVVPFGAIQQEIVAAAPSEYRIVLYRRLMVRIAEAIARAHGCEALVTGEALGQVASQTLSNIATIDAATTLPMLRPLVGMDKQEIVDAAKGIGTYDVSIEPHDDCCTYLAPQQPATRTRAVDLERIERALDLPTMIHRGVANITWRTVHPPWSSSPRSTMP